MRILNSYIGKSVLLTTLGLTFIISFVLVMGNTRELADLIMTGRITFPVLFNLILLLFPYVLLFGLPFGFLTACLLVFGRMSAENEITAMRALGVSLWQIVAPVICSAILFTILCFYINMQWAPQARHKFKSMKFELVNMIAKDPASFLEEGQFNTDFPQMAIYLGKRNGSEILDINIYKFHSNNLPDQNIRAKSGFLEFDPETKVLNLRLKNASIEVYQYDTNRKNAPAVRKPIYFASSDFGLPFKDLLKERKKKKDASEKTLQELFTEMRSLQEKGIPSLPLLLEINKRFAFSLGCLALVFIGIPLGIRAQRREASMSILLSLPVVFGYYFLIIVAETLKNKPELHPELLMWLPNLLYESLGAWLLWKLSRK